MLIRYAKSHSAVLLVLSFLFSFTFTKTANAEAAANTWRYLLEKRSSMIFTESIDLGGLRIGTRGKIKFTWIDRSLLKILEKDRDEEIDESILNGLGYYLSKKKEVTKLTKNRDIFLLSYQAVKRWDFKIEEIVINGYRLTLDDILTAPYSRVLGEIPPFKERAKMAEEYDDDLDDYELHVAVPSMPKKGKVKLSYGEDTVEWEIPKR